MRTARLRLGAPIVGVGAWVPVLCFVAPAAASFASRKVLHLPAWAPLLCAFLGWGLAMRFASTVVEIFDDRFSIRPAGLFSRAKVFPFADVLGLRVLQSETRLLLVLDLADGRTMTFGPWSYTLPPYSGAWGQLRVFAATYCSPRQALLDSPTSGSAGEK